MTQKPTYEELEKRIEELELTQGKNEAFFRKIIDLIPSCIIVKDRDGKFVLANEKTGAFYGPDVESMIGRYEYEYADLHPSNQDEIEKFLVDDRNVIDSGKPKFIPEEKFTLRNGELHTFKVSKIPVSTFGYENCVLVVATDVTELKLAEKSLFHSQYILDQSQEIANVGSYSLDISTKQMVWSKQQYRIFGYEPGEIEPDFDLIISHIHSDDRDQFIKSSHDLFSGKQDYNETYRIVRKDGTVRMVHAQAKVEFDELRNPSMTYGTLQDITGRKKMEQELLQKNAELKSIFQALPDAVVFADLDRRITQVNKSFTKLYGYTLEEIKGKKTEILYTEKKLFEEQGRIRYNPQAKNLIDPYEIKYRKKNGEVFLSETIGTPVLDEQDKAIGLVAVVRDITKKKKAEIELKKSEEKYRELVQSANSAILRIDNNGHITFFNEFAQRLFGYSEKEVLGQPAIGTIARPKSSDNQDLTALLDLLLRHPEKLVTNINENITKNGKKLWLSWTNKAIFNESGDIVEILCVGNDITSQKEIQNALTDSESQKRAILNGISKSIRYVDRSLKIIWINQAGAKTIDKEPNEIVGNHCYEYWSDNKRPCEGCPVLSTLKTNKRFQKIIYAQNGIVWDLRSEPVYNQDGKLDGIIEIADDITEAVTLERHLQQTQKLEAIGTLAGGISHDFNNLLGIITGNVSYVLNELKNDEDLTEALLDVQESAKRGVNLTRQLITFAKGGSPVKKMIELNSLIKDTAKLVLRGSNSICKFNLNEDLWIIEADEGQLNQALSNLIINSDHAMPEGGSIQIVTENKYIDDHNPFLLPLGPYVSIKLTDQGTGISEKHLSKIFDPFFTTKKKGNGLGLATTFSIIKKHNGHIWAESTFGDGTTVTIYLPAAEKAVVTKETKEETYHKGRGKILVMDDQEHMLKMARRMLGEMGYESVLAKDGGQAIEVYRKAFQSSEPFDLIILDLTVPGGIGGAKTIPELLKINPDAKVIVSSGYSNDPIMSDYQIYGFCGVLEKPYTTDQMAELLNRILGEKE